MKKWLYICTVIIFFVCGCERTAAPVKTPDSVSYVRDASAYAENGDFDKALTAIKKALEQEPDNADYLSRRGYYLQRLGKVKPALYSYVKSFKQEKKPEVAYCIGNLLAEMGKYPEAEYYAWFIADHQPAFEPGLRLLTEVELGCWHLKRAAQCMGLFTNYGFSPEPFSKELERRRRVKDENAVEQFSGPRNHVFLKTGAVLTGIPGAGTSGREESVLTVPDRTVLTEAMVRLMAVLDLYNVDPEYILTVQDRDEDIFIKELIAKLTEAKERGGICPEMEGKTVLVCMTDFLCNRVLGKTIQGLRNMNVSVYVYAMGISRSSIRDCAYPPDIGSTAGSVLLSCGKFNKTSIIRNIQEQFSEKGEALKKELSDFYSGLRSETRLYNKQ